MAKEPIDEEKPEKTEVPVWIKCVMGVVLFGITVGSIARSGGKESGAHTAQVESHELRITKNTGNIDTLKEDVHKGQLADLEQKKNYESLLKGQDRIFGYLMQYDFEKKEP